MQGKRFVAANMRLALKMVKEELGPEAIILSNKQVPGGVELLTAMDSVSSGRAHIENNTHSNTGYRASSDSDNPFIQDDRLKEKLPKSESTSQPSRLEVEVERMRQEARQRAEQLAIMLAEKNKKRDVNAKKDMPSEKSERHPLHAQSSDFAYTALNDGYIESNETHKYNTVTATADDLTIQKKRAQTTSLKHNKKETVKDNQLEQMRDELHSMRNLLEQQLSTMAWGQLSSNNPAKASMWRRLKRMGIGAEIANSLIEGINLNAKLTNSWQAIMEKLSGLLPVSKKNIVAHGGIFAFVGPTGAGKTTTIAKLATQYVLEHGATGVALITTDTMRIAAQEQLRTIARILNVPVKIVDKNNPLDRVLYSLRHKTLVLIDTAGLNREDLRLKQQLNAINELGEQIKSLLVIPTTSQAPVIKAAFHTYKTDNLSACVLTKLDETASLGESICLLVEKDLPVAYCTDGQNIPGDITVAENTVLVKAAIKLAKHTAVDKDVMADEIMSLSRNG